MTSNPTFNKETNGTTVAETYSSRSKNKIVLITGVSTGGIGEATARAFAHGGASTIIITGRDDAKLSTILNTLTTTYPNTRFRPLKLDLSSLASVQKAGQEILDDVSIPQIDILILNAGLNTFHNNRIETVDGVELHFGVNHLAHHLFTSVVLPKVRAAAERNSLGETRIIPISSMAVITSPIRFSDWNYEGKPIPDTEKPDWAPIAKILGLAPDPGPFEVHVAYSQSKTANVLMAVQLNKLLEKEGIYSFSLNPGFVGSVGADRNVSHLAPEILDQFGFKKNLDQGAATTLVAALDPALKPESGVYLNDCQIDMQMCPTWASSQEAAKRLWQLSEEILDEKLKR